jgi:hypothetical protein
MGSKTSPRSQQRRTKETSSTTENRETGSRRDFIQDKSPTDKLPPRVPSLTGLQDEMTKKFEIVAIKMVAGRRNMYYHRCKNAHISSKTCLWLFCSMCTGKKQVQEKRRGEEKDFGCKHGIADLIPCMNAKTMTRLNCEYIYASEDARNGDIPSRCVGCHKRIAIDLDNEKADHHEIRPIKT